MMLSLIWNDIVKDCFKGMVSVHINVFILYLLFSVSLLCKVLILERLSEGVSTFLGRRSEVCNIKLITSSRRKKVYRGIPSLLL